MHLLAVPSFDAFPTLPTPVFELILPISGSQTTAPSLFVVMQDAAMHLTLSIPRATAYTYDNLFPENRKRPCMAQRTVGGHIITISSDNELCVFEGTHDEVSRQELFMDAPRHMMESQHPFMCAATGVLGSVSTSGQFYIWRGRDT